MSSVERSGLGAEVTLEEGQEAAHRWALQVLSALRDALGSLDRVEGIVQVSVFVASAPGFTDQPKVANGASDVLVEILGDAGKHARAAVGVAELPLGASVEVAVVAKVSEPGSRATRTSPTRLVRAVASRYSSNGTAYLREVSTDGVAFALPAAGGVAAWSRILFRTKVVVALNTDGEHPGSAHVTTSNRRS